MFVRFHLLGLFAVCTQGWFAISFWKVFWRTTWWFGRALEPGWTFDVFWHLPWGTPKSKALGQVRIKRSRGIQSTVTNCRSPNSSYERLQNRHCQTVAEWMSENCSKQDWELSIGFCKAYSSQIVAAWRFPKWPAD